MPLSPANYPCLRELGDLADVVTKGQFATLAIDFARQLYGDDLTDEQLRGLFADRLDTLAAPGTKAVRSSVPQRFPRYRP